VPEPVARPPTRGWRRSSSAAGRWAPWATSGPASPCGRPSTRPARWPSRRPAGRPSSRSAPGSSPGGTASSGGLTWSASSRRRAAPSTARPTRPRPPARSQRRGRSTATWRAPRPRSTWRGPPPRGCRSDPAASAAAPRVELAAAVVARGRGDLAQASAALTALAPPRGRAAGRPRAGAPPGRGGRPRGRALGRPPDARRPGAPARGGARGGGGGRPGGRRRPARRAGGTRCARPRARSCAPGAWR
jgi:translation initiation factor IF-2